MGVGEHVHAGRTLPTPSREKAQLPRSTTCPQCSPPSSTPNNALRNHPRHASLRSRSRVSTQSLSHDCTNNYEDLGPLFQATRAMIPDYTNFMSDHNYCAFDYRSQWALGFIEPDCHQRSQVSREHFPSSLMHKGLLGTILPQSPYAGGDPQCYARAYQRLWSCDLDTRNSTGQPQQLVIFEVSGRSLCICRA